MALKRSKASSGTLVILEHVSRLLRDNPLGDPHVRKLAVWLPPQYDAAEHDSRAKSGKGARFPVLYDMVGFTGSGLSHAGWRAFSYNIPERVARLIYEEKMGPAIVVMPDCFTALGGNQYINSSALGRYADYLLKEIIPFVDREFRTLPAREHRGCFGKSSGGYGAIVHGMKYPSHWGAVADHSGDSYFDFVYWHDWPHTLNELGKHRTRKRAAGRYDAAKEASISGLDEGIDDGRVRRFLKHVWSKEKLSSAEVHCIMNLCMAASYDPDPDTPLGFRLPCHLETGERIERRWQRWLATRPDQSGGALREQSENARRHLHRLRLARSVSYSLRHSPPVAAPERGRRRASIRGIRRRSLGRRLSDGRQPAVSLSGVETVAACPC